MFLQCARTGKKPYGCKDLATLLKTGLSMHKVITTTPEERAEDPLPECEWNPVCLDCFGCKGFKHTGICSHVVAVHHLMNKYDLLYNTERFLTKNQKKNMGGNTRKVMPALIKEKPLPPRADSSDDDDAAA